MRVHCFFCSAYSHGHTKQATPIERDGSPFLPSVEMLIAERKDKPVNAGHHTQR